MHSSLTVSRAIPIWSKRDDEPMNEVLGFRSTFLVRDAASAELLITGANAYRVYCNSQFIHYGPARTAPGFARVESIDLLPHLRSGANTIAVEVIAYRANGFTHPKEPPFLLAEVKVNGAPVVWTDALATHFETIDLPHRRKKVQRYNYMRSAAEAWILSSATNRWIRSEARLTSKVPIHEVSASHWLPRRSTPIIGELFQPALAQPGTFAIDESAPVPLNDRSRRLVGTSLDGYPIDQLELDIYAKLQQLRSEFLSESDTYKPASYRISVGEAQRFDFAINRTGFLRMAGVAAAATTVWLVFDELLIEGAIQPLRLHSLNCIQVDIEAGQFEFQSFEFFTLRYCDVLVLNGAISQMSLSFQELSAPAVAAQFVSADEKVNTLYEAAVETYRQNAVDLFTDCPSRERAGYPCDSFFTARAAALLTGNLSVEHDFLENFFLLDSIPGLPPAVLPMCWPSDILDDQFIPQWPLWLFVELEDYIARGGDSSILELSAGHVARYIAWLQTFAREDGLLVDLPGWNFIEWSKANEHMSGLHLPSNALYANALRACGKLYKRPDWEDLSNQITEWLRGNGFIESTFVDNWDADGNPTFSEVGQYFAFFHRIASPETHGDLWTSLLNRTHATFTDAPANMFIGHYLRFLLFLQYGKPDTALREAVEHLYPMAARTGTIWEMDDPSASCCHGFAAYAANILIQSIFGIQTIDPLTKTIYLARPAKAAPATAMIPLAGGNLRLRTDGTAVIAQAPNGWNVVRSAG